jgi:hypothetical protein
MSTILPKLSSLLLLDDKKYIYNDTIQNLFTKKFTKILINEGFIAKKCVRSYDIVIICCHGNTGLANGYNKQHRIYNSTPTTKLIENISKRYTPKHIIILSCYNEYAAYDCIQIKRANSEYLKDITMHFIGSNRLSYAASSDYLQQFIASNVVNMDIDCFNACQIITTALNVPEKLTQISNNYVITVNTLNKSSFDNFDNFYSNNMKIQYFDKTNQTVFDKMMLVECKHDIDHSKPFDKEILSIKKAFDFLCKISAIDQIYYEICSL